MVMERRTITTRRTSLDRRLGWTVGWAVRRWLEIRCAGDVGPYCCGLHRERLRQPDFEEME